MSKALIIILVIVGLFIGATLILPFYFEKEKNDWNEYALNFCSAWNTYYLHDLGTLKITKGEEKPLYTYFLIKERVKKENWLSSYMECCRVLNMSCQEAINIYDEDYRGVLVDINKSGDKRLIDFNLNEETATSGFLLFRYAKNGSALLIENE